MGDGGQGIHNVDRQSLIQDAGKSERDPCKERWTRGLSLLHLAAKESLSKPLSLHLGFSLVDMALPTRTV